MKSKQLIGIIIAAIVVIAGFALIVAHGNKSSDMKMSSSTSAVATSTVKIQNYMFSPMAIKVKVGQKVTWTNQDSVSHTITADSASSAAPSSMDIAKGQSYSFTFSKAGTYTYHCFPHPFMHGTVIVTE